MTRMKLVIKGLDSRDDAKLAVEHGADGIVVSNHGGRAAETLRPTIECLPEVVDAVGARIPVFVDGGFRRGTDVYKALALGARAVGLGRAYIYGLTAFGQPGVEQVLDLLRAELDRPVDNAARRLSPGSRVLLSLRRCEVKVGQTIGFRRLFRRACGPRNFMKNVGQVANLRPIVNRPRRILNELPDFSTLSPRPPKRRTRQTTKGDGLSHLAQTSVCARQAGIRAQGRYLPVPVRLTVCGLFAAVSVNVSVPVAVPVAVGENVTPTVQLAPAATLVPQVLLETAKPALAAMLEKLSETFS